MAKPIVVKPAVCREDTQEELLAAAQKAAEKAAEKVVKNHGDSGAAGDLLGNQESFLPGVTDRHVGGGQK
jgi:hypothetical protein